MSWRKEGELKAKARNHQYESSTDFHTEGNRRILVARIVHDQPVERVLLDTGAQKTLVDSKLIQDEEGTGEVIHERAFKGTISALSLARVRIEVGDCEDELTVAVHKDLGYDPFLGTDFPDLWGMGKCLLYDEIVNVVHTHSQADKTEHTSLPGSFKEINS